MREAARRLLRCNGGSLYVPRDFLSEAEKLILTISDLVPSKIDPPVICYSNGGDIRYNNGENENFSIGVEEPDLTYCWVKVNKSGSGQCWEDFKTMVTSLAYAGGQGQKDHGMKNWLGNTDVSRVPARARVVLLQHHSCLYGEYRGEETTTTKY